MLNRTLNRQILAALVGLASLQAQNAKLKEIKPGWNLFSKDQDVQMGKEYAAQIAQQQEVLPPGPLTDYVTELGNKIATRPEAGGFPFVFRIVNDPSINAFALPGGPVFIHTGIFLNAENEGQLVGVMAHEIAHVGLRHSTNQVTKSYALQIPAMVAGVYGQMKGGIIGTLAQAGVGLGANSIIMKFSRNAETQADLLGARMMSAIGYNPIEMARFFETLEAKYGKGGSQFFSDHPNPGNRVKYVSDEITLLPRVDYKADTGKFQQMKRLAQAIPPAKKKPAAPAAGAPANQPAQNSDGTRTWTGDRFKVNYPGEWLGLGEANGPAVTLAPREGLKQEQSGQVQIGYGVMVSHYEDDDGKFDFRQDSEKLIAQITKQNGISGQPQISANQVNGRNVYVARLTSKSPLDGSTEVDTIITMEHRGGMLYVVFIAPQAQMNTAQPVFDRILSSFVLL